MDIEQYFRDLTAESQALKNRIRNLIQGQHWLSDGEWKESVVRAMIRRVVGQNIGVARGFVVSGETASTQIDILLYDASQPVLHRDGDFVVITPHACRGIIEVKTRLARRALGNAIAGLAGNAESIRLNGGEHLDFVGLFAFEPIDALLEHALDDVWGVAQGERSRVVDHIALGPSGFIRFWDGREDRLRKAHWSQYDLPQMGPGYFLHNLALRLSTAPAGVDRDWFPEGGKRRHRIRSLLLGA